MDNDFYREYATLEEMHWWFRGRRMVLGRVLSKVVDRKGLRILDIGLGTGAMLGFLANYGDVIGLDMSADAIRFARSRSSHPIVRADIRNIPVESDSVDLVTAFDILEHVDDDEAALRELARVCRPGAHTLLTVPAFQFLWGNQDVVSHHRRRYTRHQLCERVESAGLRILKLTYFNALLFPVVAGVRIGRRIFNTQPGIIESDFGMTKPGRLNDILARVFGAEAWLVPRVNLPVGVSLLCLARRPE